VLCEHLEFQHVVCQADFSVNTPYLVHILGVRDHQKCTFLGYGTTITSQTGGVAPAGTRPVQSGRRRAPSSCRHSRLLDFVPRDGASSGRQPSKSTGGHRCT
jgi:hypothetical protein